VTAPSWCESSAIGSTIARAHADIVDEVRAKLLLLI